MTQLVDLSLLSRTVLLAIVGSLGGLVVTLAFAFLRAVKNAIWGKQKRPTRAPRHRVTDSATSAPAHETQAQPRRQTVLPYKQLVHKAKASKSKKQDEGKILDHPLYIFSLKDHRDAVNGFGWSHDGSVVATACEDRCIRLFAFSDTVDKGIQARQINIQGVPVDVGFLQDGNSLVVLSKGFLDAASLMYFENQTSELGGSQWNCTKTIEKVFGTDCPLRLETVMNPEASRILVVACSAAKDAKVFDSQGVQLSSFAPNSFVNHDLAVSYNARLASIATFTADAKVWALKFTRDGSYRGSTKVMDLKGHKSKVMTVAFSMDAARAVSVSQDGVMKIWNVAVEYDQQADPKCILSVQLSLPEGDYYHRLAFGPDYALAAAVNNSIHLIDIEDGGLIETIEQAHDGKITALSWGPEELKSRKGTVRVLASSSKDKRVRLWAHPEDL